MSDRYLTGITVGAGVFSVGNRQKRRVVMRGDGRVFQRGTRRWIGYYASKNGSSVEIRESGGKTEAEARRLLRQQL
jgi:hypothetical protein